MADIISLTGYPTRVVGQATQSLDTVLDVGQYDELTLGLYILSIETPASPVLTVQVETGMQRETPDGWLTSQPVTTFTLNPAVSGVLKLNIPIQKGGFLRYLRWNVTVGTGFSALTFSIEGVGRTYPQAKIDHNRQAAGVAGNG